MAESLSSERGANGPDRAQFLDFVVRIGVIEVELGDAQETVRSIRKRRKDLRKLIEQEGHSLAEFDRALTDAQRSGEEREAADRAYRRNMEWLGKPIGAQGAFDLAPASPPVLALAEREGFAAGKRGDRADSNSYTPGREEHQRWHSGWLRGQGEKVTAEIQPGDAEPGKRRGRPKGSPNRPKAVEPERFEADDADFNNAPEQGNGLPPAADLVALSIGVEDGAAGHQDHAARYPAGTPAHADYWTGYTEGKKQRYAAQEAAAQRE